MRAARARVVLLLAALAGAPASACDPTPRAPLTPAPPAPRKDPVSVTILYTSDEHGWLLPFTEKGLVRGGTAEVLSRWIAHEGHCPGEPPPGSGSAPGQPQGIAACKNPATLLLSGGDNWTGPAISSFYGGEPMAIAMARMGYAASAFGNHDLDFGREQLLKNRARVGFSYLAANLHVKDPAAAAGLTVAPFQIFERRGVKIGVVGLATDTTPTEAAASLFRGIEFSAEEPALDRAVASAWDAGADAVVAIAHECPDVLEPILARHPEWRLSFVGGGHCHRTIHKRVGDTPLIAPGWRLQGYARIRLKVDQERPPRSRVISVEPAIVEVSHPEGAPPATPPDPALEELRLAWKERLDKALGEPLGYTMSGIAQRSPEMGHWIADAWRTELGTDVAMVNEGALRQSIPVGPITKATVYSVMPFDNKLIICTITGRDLLSDLANKETIASGLTRSPDGQYSLLTGAPLDLDRRYTIATIDFMYYGGSGFQFQKYDPSPKETGLDWRAPVIEWTKRQRTTPEKPLEKSLRQ